MERQKQINTVAYQRSFSGDITVDHQLGRLEIIPYRMNGSRTGVLRQLRLIGMVCKVDLRIGGYDL
jgi:hypothetical protein